ncbi:MAG: hypothetical protein LC775_20435, partial [Acidobacteria bacterium]|nr:hypothetical protein [Acidobacteriota bacterium]
SSLVVVPFLVGVLGGTPDTYQKAGLRRGTATSLQQAAGQPPLAAFTVLNGTETIQEYNAAKGTRNNRELPATTLDSRWSSHRPQRDCT